MKKIDPGQAINVLANIGVIAGIIFLGLEISQNNDLLSLQFNANQHDRQVGFIDLLVQDPELLELLSRDNSELSPIERERVRLVGSRMLVIFQSVYMEYREGVRTEESTVRPMREIFRRNQGYLGAAWESFKLRAELDFVEWFETNIIDQIE